jgi:hypothetical protein
MFTALRIFGMDQPLPLELLKNLPNLLKTTVELKQTFVLEGHNHGLPAPLRAARCAFSFGAMHEDDLIALLISMIYLIYK